MGEALEGKPTRRGMIGGAGALAAMMLQPGWLAAAHAQAGAVRTDPRHALIDRLSDITIPATDTPGASQAGVPVFVLMALDQRMNGLDPKMVSDVQSRLDQGGAAFVSRAPQDQLRVLTELDTAAFAQSAQPGTPEYGWRRIKAAIVAGYYSSEIGATQELVYEPVPGRFENITLTPDFRSRSNDGFGGAF